EKFRSIRNDAEHEQVGQAAAGDGRVEPRQIVGWRSEIELQRGVELTVDLLQRGVLIERGERWVVAQREDADVATPSGRLRRGFVEGGFGEAEVRVVDA